MSELKSVKQSDVMWGHWFTEYYLKSEADAYIRQLDNHHKYKRCVAMEKMCRDNYVFRKSLSDEDQWYWRRWHKRWQLLAEQFKE